MTIDIYKPEQWHDYFVMMGTSAAALTGLLFVAMSLHLKEVTLDYVLRHRALSILVGLAAVFMRSALVLMGGQNHIAVGSELLIICLIATGMGINSYMRAIKNAEIVPASSHRRTFGSLSCYLIEIIGSIILMLGFIYGLYLAMIGMVANFYYLISGSWLLLVNISLDEMNEKS